MQAAANAELRKKRFRNGAFKPCKLFDWKGFIAQDVEKLWRNFHQYCGENVEKILLIVD